MENYYSRIMALISHPLWKQGRVFLLACLVGLSAFDTYGQARTVSGTVTASDDGSSLPGVTLIIKGSTKGTVTDIDGKYSIEVDSDDAILVASFVGYETMEQAVGSRSQLDFSLALDVETLEEVVVVGYGTQKKSDLTGAVSSVTGDALRGSVTASVDQALQGRVAGVQVTQNSGQPGGAVSIRIRGTTSLTGSSEPLYVIDGVQVSGEAGDLAGFDWAGGAGGQQESASNPLAGINPDDIESMEVLKDASATAIYGSRAANGVIIITTKRGKQGEAKVTYSGYYGIQEVSKLYDMMDLPAFAEYSNEIAEEVSGIDSNERFADPSILGPGTNWQEAVFQVAPMQSHTLSMSGATESTNYYVSGGYFEQEGIVVGSDMSRFNVRANVDSKVKEGFHIGANVNFSRREETIVMGDGGDGVISQAQYVSPAVPVRNFDGTFAGPDTQFGGTNPVALSEYRNNDVVGHQVLSNIFGEIEVIKGLKLRSEFSMNYNTSVNKAMQQSYELGQVVNPVSQFAQRQSESFGWQWRNYVTYDKTFGAHNIKLMAGTEAQKNSWDGFVAYKANLPNDIPNLSQGEQSNIVPDGWTGWSSLYSWYSRLNYNFDDRLLLTATIRRDGSSKFGANYRYGWFPSASAAWRISNEGFLKQSDVISNLKLRVGWGQIGNQAIADYAFGASLTPGQTWAGAGVRPNRYSNPNVQWEATEMINVGVDMTLFDGRVDLTVEAYDKKTDNLLLEVNLPSIFGSIIEAPQANVGSMTNRGIEISLGATPVDVGKFQWSFDGNIAFNRNKVTKLAGNPLTEDLYWYSAFQDAVWTQEGYPVGQFYGYVSDGIFTTADEIRDTHVIQIEDPNYTPDPDDPDAPERINYIEKTVGLWLGDIRWVDIDGDSVITPMDQRVIGDPNPDFTFGFNNTFSYGPFTLDVYLIGTVGGDILNYSRARVESMLDNYSNQSVTVQDRARTELIDPELGDPDNPDDLRLINPNGTMPRFDNGGENNNHVKSDRWIEDGTFVRIQNIKLSYRLPSKMTQKAKMSNVLVYANVQNPFVFTNYSGLDPQVGAFEQNPLFQNVDMGRYPTPTVYTMGVTIDF